MKITNIEIKTITNHDIEVYKDIHQNYHIKIIDNFDQRWTNVALNQENIEMLIEKLKILTNIQ